MRLQQLQRLGPCAQKTSRASLEFQDFPCAILQNDINEKRNLDPLNLKRRLSINLRKLRPDAFLRENQRARFKRSKASGEQIQDRFAFAVAGHVERPLLNFVREPRRDAERTQKGRVQV